MISGAIFTNNTMIINTYADDSRKNFSRDTDVSVVSEKSAELVNGARKDGRRYEAGASGPKRLYAALLAAAQAGLPCPSNREFCRLLGVGREANVTTVLGVLRRRGLIAVEWSALRAGARRVVIPDRGIRTGWSRRGPVLADEEPRLAADDGIAMGAALGPNRRFADVTRAEAQAIAGRSPWSRALPERPQTASPTMCPLADLRENPEFDWK